MAATLRLSILVILNLFLIKAAFSAHLDEDVTHSKTVIELMAKHLRGNAHLVEIGLDPLLSSAEQRETLEWLVDDLDAENGTETTQICELCLTVVEVLKPLADRAWLVLAPTLKTLCRNLLPAINENINAAELCPGIIDHQGRALYDVLGNNAVTAPKFCENLNACIPPRSTSQKKHHRKQHDPSTARFNAILHAFQNLGSSGNSAYRGRRETDTIRIAQLADIHIEPDYAAGSAVQCGLPVCCQEKWGTGEAGPWGDYACNVPLDTMHLFLRKVADLQPDFMIFSGDTPPHTVWDESYASQLECTQILVDAIDNTLKDFNIYPNIGNHEMFPTNLYWTGMRDTRELNKEFASLWQPFANFTADQVSTMEEAGYYSILVSPGLRMLSINTNFWYSFNWYNVLNQDMDVFTDMKLFIEQELMKARTNDEKVIVVGHHPPSNADIIVTTSRWLSDVISDYSDVIVLQVGGHTHNDEIRLVRDFTSKEASGVVFLAPSVTTRTLKNPSLRIYHLDPVTFELVDYDQYHMDLMEAVANGTEPHIELVYSATEEYGLDDMSPMSWEKLLDSMWADQELLSQYLNNYNTRTVSDPLEDCDRECQIEYLCKFSTSSFDLTLQCRSDNAVTTPTPVTTPVPTAPGPSGVARINYSILSLVTGLLLQWITGRNG